MSGGNDASSQHANRKVNHVSTTPASAQPSTAANRLRLGVALEGAGWHPAAWREASSRPRELFDAGYWRDLIRTAERGLLDFATIEDGFALQSSNRLRPDRRTDQVRGRLDALLIAAAVAPHTERIGLLPTVTTTFTEPFHVAKAVATLDHASRGRGGLQAKLSLGEEEFSAFGRREWPLADSGDLRLDSEAEFAEAAEALEVLHRLWDSWEDDAIIRDVETDRFLDADRLHTVDFEGEHFSIRGPLTVPRSPQGQPVVSALAHAETPYRFAAGGADLVFTTPDGALYRDDAAKILAQLRAAEAEAEREQPLVALADLVVFLDAEAGSGRDRLARLDGLGEPLASDAQIVAGSAAEVADRIQELHEAGFAGARLRPGVSTDDLPAIADGLVPELQRRGLFHDHYEGETLRERLGLPARAANRYERVSA